jgi:F-type H+-transporting ATPase subunit epsilon
MLPEHIKLEIVTPARQVLSEQVDAIQLPGKDGYLGILPGHAPLLTALGIGALSYLKGSTTRFLTIMEGYAEVLPERVIVLAEVSEKAEEIDVNRARQAADRAQKELTGGNLETDWHYQALALERALARQQVAGKSSGQRT